MKIVWVMANPSGLNFSHVLGTKGKNDSKFYFPHTNALPIAMLRVSSSIQKTLIFDDLNPLLIQRHLPLPGEFFPPDGGQFFPCHPSQDLL